MRIRSKGAAARTFLKIALGAWVGFSAMNAQASDLGSVTAAFGNTVLATYPDGRHQRIWLREDGSYDAVGRRGKPSTGKWKLKDDKLCLKQAKPFPAPISYCTQFPAEGGIGATWTGKDIAGIPITMKLIKGIQRPLNGAGS
jgi:hypothetical protein